MGVCVVVAPVGPATVDEYVTDWVETLVVVVVVVVIIDCLLSAGVSYIMACADVVWATPTILTPFVGWIWNGP